MSRQILLADDSLTIQKVVELTFMEGDYEITAVSNGDDALGKLADLRPDVVIADVHMPGADGYEICRSSKQSYPEVPVLLLVGTFEPFEEDAAADAGADAHLKKPFDSQELMKLVESLVGDGTDGHAVADDMSFGDLEEVSKTEIGAADLQTVQMESEPIDLSQAAENEVVENFGENPPVEISEMGEAEDKFESNTDASPGMTAESNKGLSEQDVERIARRVVELIGDQVVREISWDVIPDLAEVVIKDRIRELESQVD